MSVIQAASIPDNAQGVFALLAVLADPKAYKANLQKLNETAAEAQSTLTIANDKMLEAQAKEADLVKREAKLDEAVKGLALRQAVLAQSELDLSSDRSKLTAARSTFDAERSVFDERMKTTQASVADRESAVSGRERDADRTLADAVALKADYEGRLKKLKALA